MNRSPFRTLATLGLLAALTSSGCSRDASGPVAAGQAAQADTAEATAPAEAPEVVVLVGMDGLIEHLKKENWWGEVNPDEQFTVPHLMIARIHPNWRVVAPDLPVQQKKAIFYRLILPLVMHANEMVRDRRAGLMQARDAIASGKGIGTEDLAQLKTAAVLLRISSAEDAEALAADSPELPQIIEEMLYRLDEVPAGRSARARAITGSRPSTGLSTACAVTSST
jgi:hypothetical protein